MDWDALLDEYIGPHLGKENSNGNDATQPADSSDIAFAPPKPDSSPKSQDNAELIPPVMHVPIEEYAAEEHRIRLERTDAEHFESSSSDGSVYLHDHGETLYLQSSLGDSMAWWQDHFEFLNQSGRAGGGHGPVFESYMDAMRFQPMHEIEALHQIFLNHTDIIAISKTTLNGQGKAALETVSTPESDMANIGVTIALPDTSDQNGDGTIDGNGVQDGGNSFKNINFTIDSVTLPQFSPNPTIIYAKDMSLEGAEEEEVFTGGRGNDTVAYLTAESGLVASLEDPDINTGDAEGDRYVSIENLTGSSHSDVLIGDVGDNILSGGEGNDDLFGEDGDDILNGDNGHDWLWGDAGDDQLFGGSGNDLLLGGSGNDDLQGGIGHDVLFGEQGNDRLSGGEGEDLIFGDNGNDVLDGGSGSDILFGDDGNDVLDGGSGSDILFGDDGNDILKGGRGSDILFGDDGNDILKGGRGSDILFGDNGNDVYLYTALNEGGDIIFFNQGRNDHDVLQFSAEAFAGEGTWSFAAASLGGRVYDGLWGDTDEALFLYDTDSGTLWHDSNAAEEGGQTHIADIWGGEVEADDIIVV